MHKTRLVLLPALVLVALLTGTLAVADAPQGLVRADPPDAVTLPIGPQRIVLTYGMPLNPAMTGGYVSDVGGALVSTSVRVNSNDPTQIIIGLAPNLPSGWYMVMWNTALAGGDDPLDGMTTFNVA